jgi:hypothetical protein
LKVGIRSAPLQGWNQRLEAIHQRIAHMRIHQGAGALQHSCDPLIVNLVAPAGPVEIRERHPHRGQTGFRLPDGSVLSPDAYLVRE